MKIAFISPNMRSLFDKSSNTNFGGAEVQQKLLADGLAGMGHDIFLS